MKKFETPKIETVEFAVEDVITASSNEGGYIPENGGVGGGMGM